MMARQPTGQASTNRLCTYHAKIIWKHAICRVLMHYHTTTTMILSYCCIVLLSTTYYYYHTTAVVCCMQCMICNATWHGLRGWLILKWHCTTAHISTPWHTHTTLLYWYDNMIPVCLQELPRYNSSSRATNYCMNRVTSSGVPYILQRKPTRGVVGSKAVNRLTPYSYCISVYNEEKPWADWVVVQQ